LLTTFGACWAHNVWEIQFDYLLISGGYPVDEALLMKSKNPELVEEVDVEVVERQSTADKWCVRLCAPTKRKLNDLR